MTAVCQCLLKVWLRWTPVCNLKIPLRSGGQLADLWREPEQPLECRVLQHGVSVSCAILINSVHNGWLSYYWHRGFLWGTNFIPMYYIIMRRENAVGRYCDRLRNRRPRGRCSSTGTVKNFLFSTPSRKTSGVYPDSYPISTGAKAAAVWS
jgi:hypothetical protein